MTLTQFVILVTGVPFVLAFAIVVTPINPWVRVSLVSVGITALAVLPLSVSTESDLEGIFWVGVSLWGWLVRSPAWWQAPWPDSCSGFGETARRTHLETDRLR
jgi:hypothetical protein